MTIKRSQRGISLLGGLTLLLVATGGTAIGLKLLPHYMDFYSLQNIITASSAQRASVVNNERDFYDYVERGMTVNALENLKLKDIMDVKVSYGNIDVKLDYEVREPLIGNVDVVLVFQREYHLQQ